MEYESVEMIVISSGFHKTHVTIAAREASRRRLLRFAITAAYPTEIVKRVARLLGVADKGRIARLMERDEAIPGAQLRPLFLPELLDEAARIVNRIPLLGRFYASLSVASWRLYGRLAARKLLHADGAQIYHFRAGFGHSSIDRARQLGMLTLCDHAIAHPSLLEQLIDNRGKLPERIGGRTPPAADSAPLRNPLTRAMLADIDRCDAVVVNSEFVKGTFLALGWSPDRVHVVYLGVDDNFRPEGPMQRAPATDGKLQLLFAGRLEKRKGAEVLVEALSDLGDVDWELLVAGPVAPDIESAYGEFLSDDRVRLLGTLRRPALMEQMLSVPVFVFPSFAEGSARVVFEALACGSYIITTPNSGTIVEDGVHGALIPSGDAACLAAAVEEAGRDRQMVAEIGSRNAEIVAERFQQADYGDALADLYQKLAAQNPRT
jgi:glycosyltransferase involved in cell wall biosynthesis